VTSETALPERRVPWTLLLLILAFLGPLVAAWLLMGQTDVWRPPSSNYGTLLEPLLPLSVYAPDLPPELEPETLTGQWTLLLIVPRPQSDDSVRLLHDVHQLHVALGKHADRLQRVVVSDAAIAATDTGAERDPYLHRVVTSESGLARLHARLPGVPGATHDLFLVDPLGNLIMRYPVPVGQRGVLDDLRRLMRTSQIG